MTSRTSNVQRRTELDTFHSRWEVGHSMLDVGRSTLDVRSLPTHPPAQPMDWLMPYLPYVAAMGALLCGSAFFSASEAALFNLHRRDRLAFEHGNPAQRAA